VPIVILLLQKGSLFIAPIARGSTVNFIVAECKSASLKYARNVQLIMLASYSLP